ncbi:class I SAM-dependent methyltransferase [Bradyrhizobium septentrionale]|uniref:class I SAM-dependent methyltransferase n=1 Tax=Bradyrhizobium septentrionale TaxID=1404411 RepID=UPI0030D60FC9
MLIVDTAAGVPFPPAEMMQRASGLSSSEDFEAHGKEIFRALELASPRPLLSYHSIMDFGVGCGRLARMLPDFRGRYAGVDIDVELLKWTSSHLRWVEPVLTFPRKPFPLRPGQFECVIAISVFTHINEDDTGFYLSELKRMTKPGAYLFLTVHGKRALERTQSERWLADMLTLTDRPIAQTKVALEKHGFHFVSLNGQPKFGAHEYGTTFTTRAHIERAWSTHFDVIDVRDGAIHDFQDIVVLRHPTCP